MEANAPSVRLRFAFGSAECRGRVVALCRGSLLDGFTVLLLSLLTVPNKLLGCYLVKYNGIFEKNKGQFEVLKKK